MCLHDDIVFIHQKQDCVRACARERDGGRVAPRPKQLGGPTG